MLALYYTYALSGIRHYTFSRVFFLVVDLALRTGFLFFSVLINSLISLLSGFVKGLLSIMRSTPLGSFKYHILLNFKVHFN